MDNGKVAVAEQLTEGNCDVIGRTAPAAPQSLGYHGRHLAPQVVEGQVIGRINVKPITICDTNIFKMNDLFASGSSYFS